MKDRYMLLFLTMGTLTYYFFTKDKTSLNVIGGYCSFYLALKIRSFLATL
jgi:hypothetical protein